MELTLLLQYILSLAVVGIVVFGLSQLKKALLRFCKKPPSKT